jgi:PAS domain S-box-containing protein
LELYRQIFESAPDAVVVVDEQGRISWVNRQTEELFGYARAELVHEAVEVLIPQRFASRHVEHRTRYLAAPYVRPMGTALEIFGRRKDGSEFPADLMLSSFATNEGAFVIAMARDVSERRYAEERLRELQERLRMAIEGAGLGYWSYDIGAGNLMLDASCAALLGGRPEDFQSGEDVYRHVHPGDRERMELAVAAALSGEDSFEGEFRVVDRDGSVRWLTGIGRVVRNARGDAARFTGVSFDITDHKHAAERVRQSKEQLRELIEQASDAIAIADLDGLLCDVNGAACQLLGYPREEIVGKTIPDFIPPGDVERLWKSRDDLLPGGVQVDEWSLRRKDGTYVPVEVSAKVLRDGRWQAIVRDITDRKEAAREQQALVERLQNALQEIKVLTGLLPICIHCKKIRDDRGEWQRLEAYLGRRTDAEFSHGICPGCFVAHHGE